MATYEYPAEHKDEYGARVTFAIIENVPTGNAGAGLQDQINSNNRAIKALQKELKDYKARTMIRQQASMLAATAARRRFEANSMGVRGASFVQNANATQGTQIAQGMNDLLATNATQNAIEWWQMSANKSLTAAENQLQTTQQVVGLVGKGVSMATGMGVF